MFESRNQKLLPRHKFVHRLARSLGVALLILAVAVGMGTMGYHYVVELPWVDALLNACMILTGMGPVDPMRTTAAKLFASGYALFSGIVFLSIMAVTLTPVAHRILHRFHADEKD
jgi:hypothetical protein